MWVTRAQVLGMSPAVSQAVHQELIKVEQLGHKAAPTHDASPVEGSFTLHTTMPALLVPFLWTGK